MMDSKDPVPSYTRSQVMKHNKVDDLWIIVEGSIYELSNFVFEHPGGENALLEHAGRDGTKAYKVVYNHEYPENLELLASMKIGELKDEVDTIESMDETDMLHADLGNATVSGPPDVLIIFAITIVGAILIRLFFG